MSQATKRRYLVLAFAAPFMLVSPLLAAPFVFVSYEAGNGLEGVDGVGFSTSNGNFFKSVFNSAPTGGPFPFFSVVPELEFDSYFGIDAIGPSGLDGSVTEVFYDFGGDHETNNVSTSPAITLAPGSNITGGVAQGHVTIAPEFLPSGLAPDGGDGVFVMRATVPVAEAVVGGGIFAIWINGGSESHPVNLDGTIADFGGQVLGLKAYLVADSSQNGGLGDTYDIWFQSGIDCIGLGQAPSIMSEPLSRSVEPGATVELSVVAEGVPTLTYQWEADRVPLSNGPKVSGSKTPTLALFDVTLDDAREYRVIVSNDCASVISQDAILVVDPFFCRGDANKDGVVDFFDVTTVLGEWLNLCP